MTITQQPDALSFSLTMKKLIISATEMVTLTLKRGGVALITQTYTPSDTGVVEVDLRDIVHGCLSVSMGLPNELMVQTNAYGQFDVELVDSSSTKTFSFTAIAGGVDNMQGSAEEFCQTNFLTWQPSIKYLTYYSPEWLSYYAVDDCKLLITYHFSDLTSSVQTLFELAAGKLYCMPVGYAYIKGRCAEITPADAVLTHYTVVVASSNKTLRYTYVQLYAVDNAKSLEEDWILFANSLGGIDTFRAYGRISLVTEHTHNIAEIEDESIEYRIDTQRKYTKNTGRVEAREARWLLDFFPSKQKWIYAADAIRAIVVTESTAQGEIRQQPIGYQFTFKFANARPLLNIPREEANTDDLHITVPDVGSFTVAPRLVEFPHLVLTEGTLFPVQDAYSEGWGVTTLSSIVTVLSQLLGASAGSGGGVGHTHDNIDLLRLLKLVDGYLKIGEKGTKVGWADVAGKLQDDSWALRKDREDLTNYLLRLLGGIEVGEAVDSMTAGRGTILDKDGRIQTDNLEVRGAMTVLSLIINEIHAQAGDYSYTETGTIESVVQLSPDTYQLTLHKQTEFDVTKFSAGNILYSIINNLMLGGNDYYTSWMRVLSVNTTDNTINVVLYPDAEVPGGINYAPVAGYNLTRRGDANMPAGGEDANESAQSWLISSREGAIMFLQNVYKPILESYNYAMTIGKFNTDLPMIKKLPIAKTDVGIMAKTAVFERYYQADWNGDIVPTIVDRGEWSLETAQSASPYRCIKHEVPTDTDKIISVLERHVVYRWGCKWQCLVDKTTQEPKWNASDWLMTEGNKAYKLSFQSDYKGALRRGSIDVQVQARVIYANQDITEALMAATGTQVSWSRHSGDDAADVAADNAWSPTYVDGQRHVIHIGNSDAGTNFGITKRSVEFICTIVVPDGEKPLVESFGILA